MRVTRGEFLKLSAALFVGCADGSGTPIRTYGSEATGGSAAKDNMEPEAANGAANPATGGAPENAQGGNVSEPTDEACGARAQAEDFYWPRMPLPGQEMTRWAENHDPPHVLSVSRVQLETALALGEDETQNDNFLFMECGPGGDDDHVHVVGLTRRIATDLAAGRAVEIFTGGGGSVRPADGHAHAVMIRPC